MIIIIEGPDKSGKSTLIETLRRRIPCLILKNNYRPVNEDDSELRKSYIDILNIIKMQKKNKIIILDRFFPSQLVYSILRGHEAFYNTWYLHLEKEIKKLPHLYIYCDCNLEFLKQRHTLNKDDYLNISQLELIKERYDRFYDNTILNKLNIQTEMMIDNETNVIRIISKINSILYNGGNKDEMERLSSTNTKRKQIRKNIRRATKTDE